MAMTRRPEDHDHLGTSLLVRLRGARPGLSPAEDRVAELVLADPRAVAGLTISELAGQARTSETTVLRFCRRLGLRGYPQLRLALAEESARTPAKGVGTGDISARDTGQDVIAKVAYADTLAVEETVQQLDEASLVAAADAIAGAGRVDVYGIAASGIVAADLQQKLHRIGIPAFAWLDPHLALTSATLLGRGDVAVGISHSGTTVEVHDVLSAAAERGARTVAVTNHPGSPLARTADVVLTTAARETELRSGATASRIAALTVVDCLYILVAQRNLRRARRAVEETKQAVARRHIRN